MKDIITTIGTLATLLVEAEERSKKSDKDNNETYIELRSVRVELMDAQQELDNEREAYSKLQKTLEEERAKHRISPGGGADYLKKKLYEMEGFNRQLMELLAYPARWNELRVYILSVPFSSLTYSDNRVAVIKRIRELTQWGLINSKNFLDAYMAMCAPIPQPSIGSEKVGETECATPDQCSHLQPLDEEEDRTHV